MWGVPTAYQPAISISYRYHTIRPYRVYCSELCFGCKPALDDGANFNLQRPVSVWTFSMLMVRSWWKTAKITRPGLKSVPHFKSHLPQCVVYVVYVYVVCFGQSHSFCASVQLGGFAFSLLAGTWCPPSLMGSLIQRSIQSNPKRAA